MRPIALVLAVSAAAHADPSITMRWDRDPEPAPQLDAELRTTIEGIGADDTIVDRSAYRLGSNARAETETSVWTNDRDAIANGWTITGRLSRELGGGITLTLDASLDRMIGGLERDNTTYASFGVAVTRLFHWSHGTAFISLGAGYATWLGPASSRVPAGATVGLRVGTTF